MKTFNEFITEAKDVAPHDVPQHIWDLHIKHANVEKDNARSGHDSGSQKRRQTMSFRRLNKAVKDHVGDNDRKQLEYHWKLQDHYKERHPEVNESFELEESKDTFEYHLGKLNKTAKSISTHKSYGGHVGTKRSEELRDKYDNHLGQIKKNHNDKWKSHCKANDMEPNHCGADMYA